LQWTTLKKAFRDISQEKGGYIHQYDFRYLLEGWGYILTNEQFKYIFDKFDLDQDGKISYQEFRNSFGRHLNPDETLYFR
jgi:Ca2+-binding EF-hand superfamily protein